jgi:pyruvate decarboxylase
MTYTIGSYLAARFSQMGLKHHFAVAGDYNLALLDQLLTNKDMTQGSHRCSRWRCSSLDNLK